MPNAKNGKQKAPAATELAKGIQGVREGEEARALEARQAAQGWAPGLLKERTMSWDFKNESKLARQVGEGSWTVRKRNSMTKSRNTREQGLSQEEKLHDWTEVSKGQQKNGRVAKGMSKVVQTCQTSLRFLDFILSTGEG